MGGGGSGRGGPASRQRGRVAGKSCPAKGPFWTDGKTPVLTIDILYITLWSSPGTLLSRNKHSTCDRPPVITLHCRSFGPISFLSLTLAPCRRLCRLPFFANSRAHFSRTREYRARAPDSSQVLRCRTKDSEVMTSASGDAGTDKSCDVKLVQARDEFFFSLSTAYGEGEREKKAGGGGGGVVKLFDKTPNLHF